ncbi:hypothetical protein IWQ60_009723 [Tieghemiomyces parasiticus]|uniref:Uncharacterized protein n=1 Tax=Tieghemiomyces parasiticus TaxID=78921 RepID=A0A9W7ZSS5_9FUNG|nr:hypothetical protein IWQ60_009723 [Tieghemiomyces parasiticus]
MIQQAILAAEATLETMTNLTAQTDLPHFDLVNEFLAFINAHGDKPGILTYHPQVLPLLNAMYLRILSACRDAHQYDQAQKTYRQMYHHYASWRGDPVSTASAETDLKAIRHAISDPLVEGLDLILAILARSRDLASLGPICVRLAERGELEDLRLDPAVVHWVDHPATWTRLLGCVLGAQFSILPHRRRAAVYAYPILQAWHRHAQRAGAGNEALLLGDLRYHGYADDVDRVHEIWKMLKVGTNAPSTAATGEYVAALARCGNFRQAITVYERDWLPRTDRPSTLDPAAALAICFAEYGQLPTGLAIYESARATFPDNAPAPGEYRSARRFQLALHHAACLDTSALPFSLWQFDVHRARFPFMSTPPRQLLALPDKLGRLQTELAKQEGYHFDVWDYNELITSLAYCQQLHPRVFPYADVLAIHSAMLRAGVTPNHATYRALLWHAALSQHAVLSETERSDRAAAIWQLVTGANPSGDRSELYQPLLLAALPINRIRDLEAPYLLPIPFDRIDPRFYQYRTELDALGIPLDEKLLCIFFWGLAINGDNKALQQQWRGLSIFGVPRTLALYLTTLNCMTRVGYWAHYAISMIRPELAVEHPGGETLPVLRIALLKCCVVAGDHATAQSLIHNVPLDAMEDHIAMHDLYLACCLTSKVTGPEGLRRLEAYEAARIPWEYQRYERVFNYHLHAANDCDQAAKVLAAIIRFWTTTGPCTPMFYDFVRQFGPRGALQLDHTPESLPDQPPPHPQLPSDFFASSRGPTVSANAVVPGEDEGAHSPANEPTAGKSALVPTTVARLGAVYTAFPFAKEEIPIICNQLALYAHQGNYTHFPTALTWLSRILPPMTQINFESRYALANLGQLLVGIPDHPACWEAALRIMNLLVFKLKIPVGQSVELRQLGGMLKERYRHLPRAEVERVVQGIDRRSEYLYMFCRNLDNVIPHRPPVTLRSFTETLRREQETQKTGVAAEWDRLSAEKGHDRRETSQYPLPPDPTPPLSS